MYKLNLTFLIEDRPTVGSHKVTHCWPTTTLDGREIGAAVSCKKGSGSSWLHLYLPSISSSPPSLPSLHLYLPSISSSPPSLPPLHLFLPSISPHPPSDSRWCTSSPPLLSGSLSVTGAPEIRLSSALPPLMAMSACTLC